MKHTGLLNMASKRTQNLVPIHRRSFHLAKDESVNPLPDERYFVVSRTYERDIAHLRVVDHFTQIHQHRTLRVDTDLMFAATQANLEEVVLVPRPDISAEHEHSRVVESASSTRWPR